MADAAVSIWFDLQVGTGVGDKLTPQSKGGLGVTKVSIASIIIRNVYTGDFIEKRELKISNFQLNYEFQLVDFHTSLISPDD